MTDHELVKNCMRRILSEMGFSRTEEITQRNLQFFCDQLDEKTGILISLSTAKRLLHAQFGKLPQTATLNALAQYLGYANWQAYTQNEKIISEELSNNPAPFENAHRSLAIERKGLNKKKIITLAAAAVTMFLLIAFVNGAIRKEPNFKSAVFRAQKTTANNIPNTVVFHYNVDEIDADSFFIQQSWDKNRRVRIFKNQYTLTDIYYEPGYHTAKLIADDKIIKTFDVSIPTDRWFFYAKEETPASIPEYIEKQQEGIEPSPRLTREDIARNNIDTRIEKQYILSYFPGKLQINSDDFVFKARLKMTAVRNDICPYIMLEVFCQRNFLFFETVKPGCSSNAIAQFGERFLNGKQIDLSPLSTEITGWQEFEMTVRNRKVYIWINGKKVFETSYQEPSGLITGIGFISNGLCEVEMTELKSGDGNVFYSYKN